MRRSRIAAGLLIALITLSGIPMVLNAAPAAPGAFERTWQRTDLPVAEGQAARTWMWGPEGFTGELTEPYAEAPGGERTVQYFDKARMEDNSYRAADAPWDVTNGLLVVELITGQMQLGDTEFQSRSPAGINVAGDADDAEGPTYATFGAVLDAPPLAAGAVITHRIDRDGAVSDDPGLAERNVTVAIVDDVTNHAIAGPFWDFMGASGTIWDGGAYQTEALFENRYFATGRPVTEAYWATVKVANTDRDVLMQCFERRCLTYTPDNPEGWQVEAGNVGQHYHAWRYGESREPIEGGTDTPAAELAERLYAAPTDAERYDVLLDVMDYLNVGVYDANGGAILGGAERGWSDFYLYQFELEGMAAAFGRGQHHSLADIAIMMSDVGWGVEDQPVDPSILSIALPAGIDAAIADQDALDSRGALLVYELGLRSRYAIDLSQPFTWSDVRLDVVQHFVLLAELLVSPVADRLPADGAATSNLVEETGGIVKASNERDLQQAICEVPQHTKDAWGWTKIFMEARNLVPQDIQLIGTAIDGLHGMLLAYSVRVQELEPRIERHYGHGGPGEVAHFRIKVEMLDQYSEIDINCGWIVGMTIPEKGPIEDVSVNWSWGELGRHGELDCGAVCGGVGSGAIALEATNADGIATLSFTPKAENRYPCEGCWEVEETGIVTGIALYQSRFTNLLGSSVQWAVPKSGAARWFVRWHQEPGYHVTMTKSWNDTWVSEGANDTDISSGEITIEYVITYVSPADPQYDWSTPLAVLNWTASGGGTKIYLDGDSDAEGECFGDCSCSFTWSDEWSDRTVARARRGDNNEWILYNFWFEGSPVAEAGSGEEGSSCAEHEAASMLNRGLLHDFELPLVDGSFSFTDTQRKPAVTWTIDVELIGPMPTSDAS